MSTLALIHGFLGAADDWSEVRQRLDHPSLAIEVPEAPNWIAGIEAVASRIPTRSIVVGYSMGARIALGCGLDHPDQVGSLVLVSGNPGLNDDLRRQRWTHDQHVCDELRQLSSEQFLRRWYRQDVFSSLTDAQIESLVQDKLGMDADRFVRLMTCYSIARQPNYWDRLGELAMPVILIAGKRDEKYANICREMQRRIPKSRLHLVEETGHIVQRERPEQFAALLNDLVVNLSKENVLR